MRESFVFFFGLKCHDNVCIHGRCVNFAPDKRDNADHILLSFIEPGPGDPPDLAALTEIQVDQLLMGYHHGFPVTTASGATFRARLFLYSTTFDYRGYVKWLRTAQSSALVGACWLCHIVGFKAAHRTMYTGKLRVNDNHHADHASRMGIAELSWVSNIELHTHIVIQMCSGTKLAVWCCVCNACTNPGCLYITALDWVSFMYMHASCSVDHHCYLDDDVEDRADKEAAVKINNPCKLTVTAPRPAMRTEAERLAGKNNICVTQ